MEKFFNTAGPCNPAEHYMLPATSRLPGVMRLVARRQYFSIHAARQSGKTTLMKGLVRDINASGERIALYFTVESVQAFPDPREGIAKIVECMRTDLLNHPIFGEFARNPRADPSVGEQDFLGVKLFLSVLARKAGKPLVVLFDEVDGLTEGTVVTFLRELRGGYVTRDEIPFPSSVAIVGMMDIRDMKAKVRPDSLTLGSKSPFNIISENFALRNFTADEVADLYAQHTAATGQAFLPDAVAKAYELTCGQPWLVNALAAQCVDNIHAATPQDPITVDDMIAAKEEIVRRRDTHIDSLLDRLREPRVRRIVEPVILGADRTFDYLDDDCRYVLDLGLLNIEDGMLRPSNGMYAEIMTRLLTRSTQEDLKHLVPTTPWATATGLDMDGLLRAFQEFWREHAESAPDVFGYKESLPQLVFLAFLQRVTNGGGRITREMALGSRRLDLGIEFGGQRYALELKRKIYYSEKSLDQLCVYLDRLGLTTGFLAIFDTTHSEVPWSERIKVETFVRNGKTIHTYWC